MKRLVLFLKTYRGDLERTKIFKKSVDLYNKDLIPLFMIVPESDLDLFEKECRTHNEKYDLNILSDEIVLKANNLPYTEQSWHSQQLIKLGFYKLNVCENYAIFDSDCYFISPFYVSDFVSPDKVPYLAMKEENHEVLLTIKDYFKRQGKTYSFITPGQVFNSDLLSSFERKILQKKSWTWMDLIHISPYEFNWYGEYFLASQELPLRPTKGLTKTFWDEMAYKRAQSLGLDIKDFIEQGYKALCIQNRWCHHLIYTPHRFYRFIKWKHNLFNKWNHPKIYRKNPFIHLFRFIKKARKISW